VKAETSIQISIVEILSLLCRQHNFLFFSVPNEGFMKAATGKGFMSKLDNALLMLLRKMGMTPGASDLVIGKRGRMFCLEVKAPGGTVSENQRTFCAWCERTGIPYRVVYSVQETLGQLRAWGVIG
jgi:hypothetical protein